MGKEDLEKEVLLGDLAQLQLRSNWEKKTDLKNMKESNLMTNQK